jgi:ankyrin repeat protein
MGPTEGTSSELPLLRLPNELFLEVASHLKSFKDLNSLVRTSCFFHGMFNTNLYRRAVASGIVLDDIVGWVLSRYRLASLTLLLDHGLSVNHIGRIGRDRRFEQTMLHFLCKRPQQGRSVPLARLLIQRGADTTAKDARSDTILFCAIWNYSCPIVTVLLENGVDPNAADTFGVTALHFACDAPWDNAEMIHLLIAGGANIEARSSDGDTPLTALDQPRPRVMAALLEHGADAGVHNKRRETPLHWASTWFNSDHQELAKSLLEHGAIVNATDNRGRTPLHWVFKSYRGDCRFMAKFLLENGADVNAISNDGLSPLRCAISGKRGADVVALLREHGADISVLNRAERRLLSRFTNVVGY